MTTHEIERTPGAERKVERDVGSLYAKLIGAWDGRDAKSYAALFTQDGGIVGFDGSIVDGRDNIERHLAEIFGSHPTGAYVTKVSDLRPLSVDVVLLRAIAGLVPPGQTDLHPDRTAVQTLVAVQREGSWRIASFQNTPAQLHGRPEERDRVNNELRQILKGQILRGRAAR
jgi:uncharacterized protein (TIGR02246 family)